MNNIKAQVHHGDTDESNSQKFVPYKSAPLLRTGEFLQAVQVVQGDEKVRKVPKIS